VTAAESIGYRLRWIVLRIVRASSSTAGDRALVEPCS
jgi:hypothetical protein